MDQRTYSVSTMVSHQGRSVKHSRAISKLVRQTVLPEVYKSRNEWLELIKPILEHQDSTHIVSTQIYFDGTSYTEVIKFYPPNCPEVELSFFLYTHGNLDFSEHQSSIDFSEIKKKFNDYLPEAPFRMTKDHQSKMIECYNDLLDLAHDKKLDFKLGGINNSSDEGIGVTISFKETIPKETNVKFGGAIVARGRGSFKPVKV
jgi:hypothetical protein